MILKPLIFEFCEKVNGDPLEPSIIEYNSDLQLSVVKGSDLPAFDCLLENVRTFTKADGESTDETDSGLQGLIHTRTYSATNSEITDSDESTPELRSLLTTKTMTFTNTESSDEDNSSKIMHLLSIRTSTRTHREETDNNS